MRGQSERSSRSIEPTSSHGSYDQEACQTVLLLDIKFTSRMSEIFYQRSLNVPEGLIDYYCDVTTTAQKNTIAQNVTDTRPILTVN
jgi:hypothetical protein